MVPKFLRGPAWYIVYAAVSVAALLAPQQALAQGWSCGGGSGDCLWNCPGCIDIICWGGRAYRVYYSPWCDSRQCIEVYCEIWSSFVQPPPDPSWCSLCCVTWDYHCAGGIEA